MNSGKSGLSRRRFAMAGLSAGASLFASHALLAEGIPPLLSKSAPPELAVNTGTPTSFAPLCFRNGQVGGSSPFVGSISFLIFS
jgi:hypothetical protein